MMMFGFGWLMMLLVVGLPTLLVVLLLGGTFEFFQNRVHSTAIPQNQASVYQPQASSNPASPAPSRYCSHCGSGLQADWTHCPQCGSPIQ